jgi:glucuronate isomerase
VTGLELHPDRLFPPEPTVRAIARRLYHQVGGLPIISPHGHVDPTDDTRAFCSIAADDGR